MVRWKKNPKLKEWWKQLTGHAKVEWFRKWQRLTPKEKADMMSFVERGILAHELLEDEVDKFITFDMFVQSRAHLNVTIDQHEAKWQEEIDSCRAECKFARNQWLVPRFEGIERRSRTRVTQQFEVFRQVDITSADHMDQLWQQSKAMLTAFQQSIPETKTIDTSFPEPHVTARPEEQPQRAAPANVVMDNIVREVEMRVSFHVSGLPTLNQI